MSRKRKLLRTRAKRQGGKLLDDKQHGGKWQHLKGGSGMEITFMAPSVQPLQGAQLVCFWGYAAPARHRAPHCQHTCSSPAAIWLEHSRDLGYKILLWRKPYVAKSGQSLSYSAMILLYGCVQCKAGSADLMEQVSISPNRAPIGRISCTEFGPRPVLQECVMTTTWWRILWNLILGLLEQVAAAFAANPFTEWSGCSRAHISLVATSWQLLFHLWTANQKNKTPLPKHMHKAGSTGSAGWCLIFHSSGMEACAQIWGFVRRLSVVTPKPSVSWSPRLVLTTGRRGASQESNSPVVSFRLRKTWTGSQHQLWKEIIETLLALTSCYWVNEMVDIVKSCSCPGKFFTVLPAVEVLQTFSLQ